MDKIRSINILKIILINVFLIFFQLIPTKNSFAKKNFIIIQSTTSTRDTGFYEYILPKYNHIDDTEIRVVAVGTGQAIKNAMKCDADILLVHDKKTEELFVKEGFGLYRKDLMYNDYVLIGPKGDQLKFKEIKNIQEALKKIYDDKIKFISRGDDSGTNKKEIILWKNLGLKVNSQKNSWYWETGSGMGSSLNIAVNKNAIILVDRASWISFNNKRNHTIFVEGDNDLYNYYGIIPINPTKCPKSKIGQSEKFINWLLSDKGQELINSFKNNGQQLFFGNATN
jgi:tungstate transport system substrate-binding protein